MDVSTTEVHTGLSAIRRAHDTETSTNMEDSLERYFSDTYHVSLNTHGTRIYEARAAEAIGEFERRFRLGAGGA